MEELTDDDLERARTAGTDDQEDAHHADKRLEVLGSDELWERVMGDRDRLAYRPDAVALLRQSYDTGASQYW